MAAAAVVAAGLEPGKVIAAEIAAHEYDPGPLLIPASVPELADAALAALLTAAGRDGAWHEGWVTAETASHSRRTTDQLASIFYQYQHRHEQEPWNPDPTALALVRRRRCRIIIRSLPAATCKYPT